MDGGPAPSGREPRPQWLRVHPNPQGHEALGEALGRPSTSEPSRSRSERSTPPGAEEGYLIIDLDEEEEPVESNSG